MPGRRSRLFNILAAISLILLICVYSLWLPSAGAQSGQELSWRIFGVRYTLRSFHGWLTLVRSPPNSDSDPAVATAIAKLTNDDLTWTIVGRPTRRVVIHSQIELDA